MTSHYHQGLLLAVLVALSACLGTAGAQERRAGGGDQALKRAQYMLRQVSQEKRDLEAALAAAEDEMQSLEKEIDKQNASIEALESRLEQAGETNDRLVERIRSDANKYRELLGRYRDTVVALKQANADNRFLADAVKERETWIERCRDKNQGLYEANRDLMTRYKKAGFATTEGILGLERVTLENEVQAYRFRIEDLQVEPFKPGGGVSAHVREPGQGVPMDEPAPAR